MCNVAPYMNDILEDWKKEHDLFHAIPFSFSVENGFLFFRKCALCAAEDDLMLDSSEFDAESITFRFNLGRSVTLHIAWPEDLPPEISAVTMEHNFRPAGELHFT